MHDELYIPSNRMSMQFSVPDEKALARLEFPVTWSAIDYDTLPKVQEKTSGVSFMTYGIGYDPIII